MLIKPKIKFIPSLAKGSPKLAASKLTSYGAATIRSPGLEATRRIEVRYAYG
jgi:hypothetical protein